MNTLFQILLSASLIALIVGIIKPSLLRLETRLRVVIVCGIATLVFVVLGAATEPSTSSTPQASTATQPQAVTPTPAAQAPVQPQTDQQKLEAAVQGQLGSSGIKVTFRDANIDSDDPDRPAKSNFVTINLELGDFWDKDQLTRESGTLASNIIQQVYPINPHFYDVLVMFNGPTKDQYGNSSDAPILSYGTDRPEEQKINWVGFDKKSLCSLLDRDAAATGDVYLGCHFLVNVQ